MRWCPSPSPISAARHHAHFANNPQDEILLRNLPARRLATKEGEVLVATVFDLLVANYGVDRGLGGGNVAKTYDDDVPYTPAWQEKITGVKRGHMIALAREFAENADKTQGKFHGDPRRRGQPLVPRAT